MDKDAPGLKNMGKLEKMGFHSAETGEIVFEDCRFTRALGGTS
ncbi:MAG: hypothetical protein SWO11_06720 [Thermodesulfobacteriota bacterium]|nr:hypothetical protein [Thermodesulfobacteriota bacterium]